MTPAQFHQSLVMAEQFRDTQHREPLTLTRQELQALQFHVSAARSSLAHTARQQHLAMAADVLERIALRE